MVRKFILGLGSNTRTLAFLFIFGCLTGSLMPESGNLVAHIQGLEKAHTYNSVFLVVGIMGILCSSLALYIGHKSSGPSSMASRRSS